MMKSTHISEYEVDGRPVEVNEMVTDSGVHYVRLALCDRSDNHGDIMHEHWVTLVMGPDEAIWLSKALKKMGRKAKEDNNR